MARNDVLKFKRDERLTFIDIATLKVIIAHRDSTNEAPTRDDLFHRKDYNSKVNDWLEKEGIDSIYATPITGSDQLDMTFRVLRKLGFLTPSGPYEPTKKGRAYLEQVGRWRDWPLSVPIDKKNNLIEDQARYAPPF